MILELDCGNSFIKWRLLTSSRSVSKAGVASGISDILGGLLESGVTEVARCRMVSVRSDVETRAIISVLSESLGVDVVLARPAERLAGVVNAYQDYQRLGLDRWLAIVGAFDLCGGACLIIDVGTAVTVDLVAGDGRHLGGYIAPGMALLRGQLVAHTRRIQYGAEETDLVLNNIGPGKSTAEAVERGCLIMLKSYISSQVIRAEDHLGEDFVTYITGGDALLVADLPSVTSVPDLIFRGLALACP